MLHAYTAVSRKRRWAEGVFRRPIGKLKNWDARLLVITKPTVIISLSGSADGVVAGVVGRIAELM